MRRIRQLIWISCRLFLPLLGAGLLGYMVFRAGPGAVWKQIQEVGWGLAVIIILGGLSQLIKTCAWRQTLTCDIHALSWSRSLGAQLASDAVGQFGFAGKATWGGPARIYGRCYCATRRWNIVFRD